MHAVSVGEVQAAAALVRELRRRVPGLEVVLTTVTATGAARARAIFGTEVRHGYLPYDLPGPVGRFLDRIRPCAVVVLETEIWPTLYRAIGRRGLPLVMASARISERSVSRYRRAASLVRDTLSGQVLIGAQSAADAARFVALGAPADSVRVTGNVKFDLEIPATVIAAGRELRSRSAARSAGVDRRQHARGRGGRGARGARRGPLAAPVGAARCSCPGIRSASTRCGHCSAGAGTRYAGRSAGALPADGDDVFLVDTIGELQMFYAFADAAFVGGSLVPVGGHSLLEPAVLGPAGDLGPLDAERTGGRRAARAGGSARDGA